LAFLKKPEQALKSFMIDGRVYRMPYMSKMPIKSKNWQLSRTLKLNFKTVSENHLPLLLQISEALRPQIMTKSLYATAKSLLLAAETSARTIFLQTAKMT
jgi:hypothetical protein